MLGHHPMEADHGSNSIVPRQAMMDYTANEFFLMNSDPTPRLIVRDQMSSPEHSCARTVASCSKAVILPSADSYEAVPDLA
jgi:hypothetical protein